MLSITPLSKNIFAGQITVPYLFTFMLLYSFSSNKEPCLYDFLHYFKFLVITVY